MEFSLTADQKMMQDSVGRTLERTGPLERVRNATDSGEPYAGDVFSALVELGVPGILVPEEFGGLGLSLLDAALAAEMLGRHVSPVPFGGSAVMAPLALSGAGSKAQKVRLLPKVAKGEIVIGVAVSEHAAGSREKAQVTAKGGKLSGRTLFVVDFAGADFFIVADKFANLHLVDAKAKGLEKTLLATIDATRRIGELSFDNVEAEPLAEGNPSATLERIIDAGRIILAADTLGAAERMIEKAVAYAKERKQFGRVIGSFQAVKHMCAEMAAEIEPARAPPLVCGLCLRHVPGTVAPHGRAREGASLGDRTSDCAHGHRSAWRHGLHRSPRPALLVQAHRRQSPVARQPRTRPQRRGDRAGLGGKLGHRSSAAATYACLPKVVSGGLVPPTHEHDRRTGAPCARHNASFPDVPWPREPRPHRQLWLWVGATRAPMTELLVEVHRRLFAKSVTTPAGSGAGDGRQTGFMGEATAYTKDTDGLPVPQRYWASVAIGFGITMAVIDGAIANVALPTIARDLHTDPSLSIWIVNGYQLAITISLLPLAGLGEIVGYRRVYLVGLALFTLASLACAFSRTLTILALARVVQGFGAAGVMSVNTALVRFIYPQRLLGRGIGINALIVSVSAAIGPTIASMILTFGNWPWLFAVNVPFGIASFVIGYESLPRPPRARHPFDLVSAALTAGTFGFLIASIDALAHGEKFILFAAEAALAAIFANILIRRERAVRAPLLPVDLLRIPMFRLSVATSICSFVAQMQALVALPFLLQLHFGYTAVETGLLITPWPIATGIAAWFAGRLVDRIPVGLLGAAGLLLFAAGLLALALLPVHPHAFAIVWRMALSGIGFGMFQTPNNRAILNSAPRERSGGASGMLGTARLLGQTTGAALVALVFARMGINGAAACLYISAGFALAAAGVSSLRLLDGAEPPRPAR